LCLNNSNVALLITLHYIRVMKNNTMIYTERELFKQTEVEHLGQADLIVFDAANPQCEGYVLLGWDEVGMFTQGMKQPRYRFQK